MTEFSDEGIGSVECDSLENKRLENKERTKQKTSKYGTLLHLIKANIGPGILALPHAISNAGLVVGTVGLILLGIVCIYCMHLVVNCSKIIVSKMNEIEREKKLQKLETQSTGKKHLYIISEEVIKKEVPNIEVGELAMPNENKSLDYATTAEQAFRLGPSRCQGLAPFIRFTVNAMLVLTQFGFCCVYFIFIADSLHEVFSHLHILPSLSPSDIMLIELPLILLLNLIPRLSSLTLVTTTAVVLQATGLAAMFYFFWSGERSDTVVPYMADAERLPLYFGTAMYAFEGIGVVLPLENEMRKPELFGGWTGVLNTGMCIVGVIFTAVAVCGYVKYGAEIEPSITFNLPSGWLSELIRLMFAFAVLLTYPLQMYVPFSFTLPYLKRKLIRATYHRHVKIAIEGLIRASFVLFTFAIASAVPMLDLIISFIGAFASSALALILPPVIQILTIWELDVRHKKVMIAFDVVICIFGIFGLLFGSGTSMYEMWKVFSYTNTSSHFETFNHSTVTGFS